MPHSDRQFLGRFSQIFCASSIRRAFEALATGVTARLAGTRAIMAINQDSGERISRDAVLHRGIIVSRSPGPTSAVTSARPRWPLFSASFVRCAQRIDSGRTMAEVCAGVQCPRRAARTSGPIEHDPVSSRFRFSPAAALVQANSTANKTTAPFRVEATLSKEEFLFGVLRAWPSIRVD